MDETATAETGTDEEPIPLYLSNCDPGDEADEREPLAA
jgi:hypothetical protein